MRRFAFGRAPVVTLSILLIAVCATLVFSAWRANGGHFVYPLDDTYLTMAIAKHLSAGGVWGITPFEFSSSSSTPLFVLLLAGLYRITGATEWWPVVLSMTFAILSLWAADRVLRRRIPDRWRLPALLVFAAFVPLHVTGLIGMEHSLHLFLVLLFAEELIRGVGERPRIAQLCLLAALMTATRYEGLFLAGIASVLLAASKRRLAAGLVIFSAVVPVAIVGIISTAKGWYWLPASISLKGAHAADSWWSTAVLGARNFVSLCRRAPHLVALALLLWLLVWNIRRAWKSPAAVLLISAGFVALCQLTLADVGWVFRYEAYAVGLGVVAVALAVPDLQRAAAGIWWTAAALAWIATGLLVSRCFLSVAVLPVASHMIYSQQVQMARFLHRYYDGTAVAANDVGAINYMSDLKCLDLAGLADLTIFSAKKHHSYTTAVIAAEAGRMGTEIAILYDDWFTEHPPIYGGPPMPRSWHRIGRWRIRADGPIGGDTVSFYAVLPEAERDLRLRFQEFSNTLPAGVTVMVDP